VANKGCRDNTLGSTRSTELAKVSTWFYVHTQPVETMFEVYSQKLAPPYSGLVHIAKSGRYRAVTLDGQMWEIQHLNRINIRAAAVSAEEIKSGAFKHEDADPKLVEIMEYLADVKLPFPSKDHFECWILDSTDESPLAMLYSCVDEEQMRKFPKYPDWTALPDSVMPVVKTDEELASQSTPVNYRVEMLVASRAGVNKKARWFDRREHDADLFHPFLLREDWIESQDQDLVWRYIARQAPRLLLLPDLSDSDRERLEVASKHNPDEVARFAGMYPKIINQELMNSLLVMARIRAASGAGGGNKVLEKRDGVFYL